jgi:hypothetical protein
MEPNTLTRLKRVAGKQTTILTHYERTTRKPHEVTIWFVLERFRGKYGAKDVKKYYSGIRCGGCGGDGLTTGAFIG